MSRHYTIRDFKVGDFKDQNNNTWCNVVFEEEPSEQYRWVVKDPTRVTLGTKVYGRLEEKTSQQGKPYMRFYKEQEPDGQSAPSTGGQASAGNSTDESIARAVALKAAVELHADPDNVPKPVEVLKDANIFLAWLKQTPVSGSQGKTQTSIEPVATTNASEPQSAAPANPKRPWENRQPSEPTTEPLPEYQPGQYDAMNDEEFDPNQIPF